MGRLHCRYPWRDFTLDAPPLRSRRDVGASGGGTTVTAMPAGEPAPVLVPRWLTAADRAELTATVGAALATHLVHPGAAIHLQDVLTELHVAAARDAVWPASAARVRLAAGWGPTSLPVRLSAAELAGVLAVSALPAGLRAALLGDRA